MEQYLVFVQINRERVGTFVLGTEGGYRDVAMIQDCDTAVSRICDMCGWAEDLKKLVLQGDASRKQKAKTNLYTNHTTTRTTKPKEVKERYTSYKPTSKNKTNHTHRTTKQ